MARERWLAGLGTLLVLSVGIPAPAATLVQDGKARAVVALPPTPDETEKRAARDLIDHCAWTEAEMLLRPLAKERNVSRAHQVALVNTLGVCCTLTQCYDEAETHFSTVAKMVPNDARIRQNQALNYELQGEHDQAEEYWDRFLDLLADAEDPLVALDLVGGADRLGRVVGELDGRPAVGADRLADQAERAERVAGGEAAEVVGEQGPPAEAELAAAVEAGVERLDPVDVEQIFATDAHPAAPGGTVH